MDSGIEEDMVVPKAVVWEWPGSGGLVVVEVLL